MIKQEKTFIIAELSANHNQDFNLAVKTIEAMAEAGADAVKIQTFKPGSLTLDLDTGYFAPRTEGLWKGYTPWKLFQEAAMPYEWQPKLKKVAEDFGMLFFSSPFDLEAVDFLESIGVGMYKIASMEITDIPLIENVASRQKPVIISTGVAEPRDIELALQTCYNQGNRHVSLLKCTSEYPAPIEKANLRTIPHMMKQYQVPVGVSDHTMGNIVPVVAVSLGACIVEKHFILHRSLGGPDSGFSMEPHEFTEMVQAVRQVELALGNVSENVSEKDKNRRRSLFVVKDIQAGEALSPENIRSIRPGAGLHPKFFSEILGKKAKKNIPKGSPLSEEDFA
ncbi:MAG TPA: pseudaminic acid synthase [Bacteroidales bacterium]|nr:pseudaminic acid synthase [Bacteroidales bacterium]